jgi:ParB-like chromosome segregation protein Spo0J
MDIATSAELSVQYVPIDSLKPSAYNPRRWSKEQLAGHKESITRFSVVDPLIAFYDCA